MVSFAVFAVHPWRTTCTWKIEIYGSLCFEDVRGGVVLDGEEHVVYQVHHVDHLVACLAKQPPTPGTKKKQLENEQEKARKGKGKEKGKGKLK